MAACGSLEHIFDKPLPEKNQSFLESLSPWKHIKSPIDESSFTEIFGELHFKENSNNNHHVIHSSPESSPSSSISSNSAYSARPGIDIPKKDQNGGPYKTPPKSSYYPSSQKKHYKHSDSFSSMNSESLSLCTEGLGFESFDDVEDLIKIESLQQDRMSLSRNVEIDESNNHHHNHHHHNHHHHHHHHNHHKSEYYNMRSRISRGDFPPPISCIGRSGKPWVCFKSYRQDGRFILKEIRIPTQEFLHACREDGRLRLQFISSDDEVLEEEDEDEEHEDDVVETNGDDDGKEENLETCNFEDR